MTETARTAVFAAVAAAAVVLAAVLSWPGATAETAGFEQVGTPFFTAFESNAGTDDETGDEPSAGNLSKIGRFTITAFDADTGAIQDFRITRDESTGLYGIAPYDYPAEAAEKLAEVAAALGSVKRTALQSRRQSDWADLGVVDPASEDVGQLEGRGLRVELTGDDGNPLADLIIGKPVEDRDGYFYVREPRDDSTYIAKLDDLDLSARFRDWVDPEALEVAASDLRKIVVPDETIDPRAGELLVGDPLALSREDAAGEWTAESLPEGRAVDQAKANALASTATGLTIAGVRPKPKGLKPDLTLDPAVVQTERQYSAIVRDITGKGFSILPTPDGGGQVIGEAGQLTVVTDEGVAYDLDFGELFTGNNYDFAVGEAGEGYKTLSAEKKDDDASGEDADEDAEQSQGRYLFVIARLDAAALGEPPVEPQPPTEDESAAEKSPEDAESEDAGSEGADDAEDADSPQKQYERELAAYPAAKRAYDEKLAAAKERVEELNRRFGDWYYVVDADDVVELSLTPAALLQDAAPALPDAGAGNSPSPGMPAPIETPGSLEDLLKGLSPGMPTAPPADGAPEEAPPAQDAPEEDAPAEQEQEGTAVPTEPAMSDRSPESPEPTPSPENPAPSESMDTGDAAADEASGEARPPVSAPRPTPPAETDTPAESKDPEDSTDEESEPGSNDGADSDEETGADDAGSADGPGAA
ncbi:DUF4340 domain-containing protein [Alienimonas chondri]|uniref:DUF4340 domain-containing protein n=1 Tax=Alienimonas chondri TaxID=2681879 RepID=A0ABX1VB94_9PLAN|nr:DUF4340 domain-containing protein [Alienimonas chondri]NNJ25348.1 hypothetical protein [Alienimonas chondri]